MARKTAFLGVFCAAALILSYIESLIPFFAGIPGMKLGLANAADDQVRLAGTQVSLGTMTVEEAVAAFGTLK